MTDILAQIDAAIEQHCACGCGRPLSPASPSGYYATEGCQQRWLLDQRDPDRARRRRGRPAQRTHLRDDLQAMVDRFRAGTPTEADRQAMAESARQANMLFAEIARQIQPVIEVLGRAVNRFLAQTAALHAVPGTAKGSADARERALARVRNRNTGPQARQRAPRRIAATGRR